MSDIIESVIYNNKTKNSITSTISLTHKTNSSTTHMLL